MGATDRNSSAEKTSSDRSLQQQMRERYPQDELDIAYRYAKRAREEFDTLIKALVLFGSTSRGRRDGQGDIDVLLVLDDVNVAWTKEMAETYQIISERIVGEISKRLHITTLKMTTYWEHMRNGDPIGLNILRDGVAIIDTGFFAPLQQLLHDGRIKPSAESVWTYLTKAQATINNSRWHLFSAIVDCYWAGIDACHAALMRAGHLPPSPDHVAEMVEKHLVPSGRFAKEHAETMRQLYTIYKAITHRTIDDVAADQYEVYYVRTKRLIDAAETFISSPAVARK